MKIVTVMDYESTRGEKPKGRTLTQLAEYQPMQKMLANLTIAGLNSAAKQAMEFYDSHRSADDVDIPLLPRHISPDIVDVQKVAAIFAERKALIEEKVREARERQVKELRAAQQAASKPPSGAPGSGGGVSAPVGGEPPK